MIKTVVERTVSCHPQLLLKHQVAAAHPELFVATFRGALLSTSQLCAIDAVGVPEGRGIFVYFSAQYLQFIIPRLVHLFGKALAGAFNVTARPPIILLLLLLQLILAVFATRRR